MGQPRPRRLRRVLLVLGVLAAACGLGGGGAAATVDRWLFVALDPGPFDPAETPPPPDYDAPSAWAALPEADDAADRVVPGETAVDQRAAPADVFYVHPTTRVGGGWNAPVDDATIAEATARGGTLIQASAFNGCCAIYAPRYRQANGRAFTVPDERGDRAVAVAYEDVAAAFEAFLAKTGDRPFILAGHSQGSVLAARLLREEVRGKAPAERLVAAYLIGVPLVPEDLGPDLPLCASATATGCVVTWNARGPRYEPNGLEFAAAADPARRGRLLCVSPLTWRADGRAAPASANPGALFLDAERPAVLPDFAAARCSGGWLVVTEMGDPPRDGMSQILDWMIGPENYHPIEYQLFYTAIRENAEARVEAFLAAR